MVVRGRAGRLAQVVIVVCALALLAHIALRLLAFKNIFYEHAGITLTQQEVLDAHAKADLRTPVVPQIIHQIFHNWTDPSNEDLPSDWDETRKTCFDLNPEWEYWLWTSPKSRDFISREYSWFLKTYDSFTFPIQRIDALKYFLMLHYGGIYIDLDNGCASSLDALRYYPTWITDGGHGALSNNILAGEPGHPFWKLVTDSLIPWSWDYPLPYVTIMYATGQWFLTAIWQEYHDKILPKSHEPELMRVMMDGREGAAPWVIFTHSRGGTWDNWDNRVFGWIGDHVLLFVAMLVGLIVLVAAVVIFSVRYIASCRSSRKGYTPVRS